MVKFNHLRTSCKVCSTSTVELNWLAHFALQQLSMQRRIRGANKGHGSLENYSNYIHIFKHTTCYRSVAQMVVRSLFMQEVPSLIPQTCAFAVSNFKTTTLTVSKERIKIVAFIFIYRISYYNLYS